MDAAQKERILKRLLSEYRLLPAEKAVSDLTPVAGLGKLLDLVKLHHHGLFDFSTLEHDEAQWKQLKSIIESCCTFISLSQMNVDCNKAIDLLRQIHRTHAIATLSRDDYYARPTDTKLALDPELKAKIIKSRAQLYALTQTFPGASAFDAADVAQVNAQITLYKNLISPLAEDNPQKNVVHKRLQILKDLNRINQLECISIPQDNRIILDYCVLPVDAGGSTEKISLIKLDTVLMQLGQLCVQERLTVDSYYLNRNNYKLSTEAILKLPKHGVIEEVQREAMALNISRLMGLETARCTTVSHKGQPALFVPFDTIQLLQEFTSGITFSSFWSLQGKSYTHYSTIKPVGEGLQADQFIEDFGNSLALFYLCSDTDAVGGYCQNKALKNAKTLFIFDQVLMSNDKFVLDSRLSLQPNQTFFKHTRHGNGRNRTLIEDSSMITKYQSLMDLKELSGTILQYVSQTAEIHRQRADELKHQLKEESNSEKRTLLSIELSHIHALEQDAELIKRTIDGRISAINNMLPKTSGSISTDEVRQALILEKLINNPILYSEDGRPYKNPWTTRNSNPVQHIKDIGNATVEMCFHSKIPPDLVDCIKRHGGGNSIALHSSRVLHICRDHLKVLGEDILHPEQRLALAPDVDYLSLSDLETMKKAYADTQSTQIIECVNAYRKNMSTNKVTLQLECITHTQASLLEFIKTAQDKGFGKHVLKKFHFDAQQKMQKLMGPLKPANLNQAFWAAMKLDRISDFNAVVLEALAQTKLSDPQFIGFLAYCIQRESQATNYNEAVQESLALSQEAQRLIGHLNLDKVPVAMQLNKYKGEELLSFGTWVEIENDLMEEKSLLSQAVAQSISQEEEIHMGQKLH